MNRKYYLDEIWVDMEGYEERYQISNYGRIRSLNYRNEGKVQMLHISAFRGDYLKVGLRKDGKVKYYRVHRLVAQNFLPCPTSGQTQVEHIDGNRQNNYVKCEIIDGNIYVHRDETNIRWTTPKGNMANEITRLRISIANSNPSEETRRRMSEGQKRRFARERATKTGRYAESNN